MKQFVISEQLINGILQYLSKQPYVEVAGLIQAAMQLKEFTEAPSNPIKET
jgi:hypothetical protein